MRNLWNAGTYINRESEKLQILYSTIDRRRGTTKVYMVGNTISRVCPYLYDWNLLETVRHQKQGEIKIVETGTEIETDSGTQKVTIAIEYCKTTGGKKLAFGESAKMIDTGNWQAQKQPKLEDSYKKYKVNLRIGFEYSGFKFIGELLTKEDKLLWFIYPYNKNFYPDTIVFSDSVKESIFYQRNIYDISFPNEDLKNLLRDTFRENMIFYSDDLTGTDFKTAIDFEIKK